MSKTQKISVTNFKAIDALEIDFKGCTAIVTGGNNKGKSSFLKGITDRIRGSKPDLIVKQGEKEGKGTIELTSGEKFIWEFDVEKTDKLTFVTKEGFKTKVTKEIVSRFFPPSFDIDKFLNSEPKKQSEQLQKIVGINFSEIDARYAKAYADRTEKNKEAERYQAKLKQMLECPEVHPVDLTELLAKKEAERTRLNKLYTDNKAVNDEARDKWNKEKERIHKEVTDFNFKQAQRLAIFNSCTDAASILFKHDYKGKEVSEFLEHLRAEIEPQKTASELYPKEPEYIKELPDDSALQIIDKELLDASQTNADAQKYSDYIAYVKQVNSAQSEAKDADDLVKKIAQEREDLIKTAKMPTGITFGEDGILVDGFSLDKNQISTSKLYCAALRIASLNIGEVRTLHFDASFLDKNTLAEIEAWADENDLQLLIERADFDAGNIKYELIEKL